MNSDDLKAAIDYAIMAHTNYPKAPRVAVRYWDNTTPYVIHPIWCAMTLLTETTLPDHVRHVGYLALLYHDTVEDTTMPLPNGIPDEVRDLVEGMTFENFQDEMANLWERSDVVKLLKLYDKVSNLLDGSWMQAGQWNNYVEYTRRIASFVAVRYGPLNIVRIASAICRPREGTTDAI